MTNALTDQGSISIHVYGGNIGAVRRHTFDVKTGELELFVSGYTQQGAAQPVGPFRRGARRLLTLTLANVTISIWSH